MGQAIPEHDSDETSASVSTNPTPRQDGVPESYSSETSPVSRPLDLVSASAEQEFHKMKPCKVRRTDSGKLHRVKHGILSREALAVC